MSVVASGLAERSAPAPVKEEGRPRPHVACLARSTGLITVLPWMTLWRPNWHG